MSNPDKTGPDILRAGASIQDRCFHANGVFVGFSKWEIEQTIPERFKGQAAKHSDGIAVKTKDHIFTYDALDQMANSVAQVIQSRCGETNEPIALLLEQRGESIAAILGSSRPVRFMCRSIRHIREPSS